MLALLKAKYPRLASVVLYALAGLALVSVIVYTSRAFITLSKQQSETTIENVESNIKVWIDAFGLISKKEKVEGPHFAYTVILQSTIPIVVKRTKERGRYISFQTILVMTQKEQDKIAKMSNKEVEQIELDLILELARLNIEWEVSRSPLRRIFLSKSVPITSNLTEATFIDHLHEMANAYILCNTKFLVVLSGERNL